MSNNTIPQADIENAFRLAQNRLGINWQLKDKGHCPRVALFSHISRAAAKGADKSHQEVRIKTYHNTYCRVFPLDLANEAARILGVNTNMLISRTEYDGQPRQ